jgi:hypothetical protein
MFAPMRCLPVSKRYGRCRNVARGAGQLPAGSRKSQFRGYTGGCSDDWVLLATWQCGEDVEELDHGIIHWVVRRRDLMALRFDRVFVHVDMI